MDTGAPGSSAIPSIFSNARANRVAVALRRCTPRQRTDLERFGQTGHAHQKTVPLGEHGDHHFVDDITIKYNPFIDFRPSTPASAYRDFCGCARSFTIVSRKASDSSNSSVRRLIPPSVPSCCCTTSSASASALSHSSRAT